MTEFKRQRAGYYTDWSNRFSILRDEDSKGWKAFDTKRIGGLDSEGLVGTYATLDEAKAVLSRIDATERAEQRRKVAEQNRAEKEAREAAKERERIERQSTEPSAYNHDVYLDLRITHDEAIGLVSRLLDHAKGNTDDIQIVVRTSHAGTNVVQPDGSIKWTQQRVVDIQPGWSGFDTAHATIVDSAVEACDQYPVGQYSVA